jgi:hypothetical protein
MHPGEFMFLVGLFIWLGLVIIAPLLTLWALFPTSRRRGIAVIALCLWSALAGAALMGAIWGWIATENRQYQLRKIAQMPEGAKPTEVDLEPMNAITFFVQLDRLGRRVGYLTVLVPLVGTAVLVRRTRGGSSPEKPSPKTPESELFSPYGP